ncbi:hypothetical protein CPLU01_13689 [Colletotrichum plurivorum]|uniref:Uncharacterized protein n=1 Tax=Colletotrichum plurivorum TaxID=2175906 RepID=A0A8H6N2E4_9PEZI|nr:hypothetical protein CPLU01_13689 [Colletotrichum plurivorum]
MVYGLMRDHRRYYPGPARFQAPTARWQWGRYGATTGPVRQHPRHSGLPAGRKHYVAASMETHVTVSSKPTAALTSSQPANRRRSVTPHSDFRHVGNGPRRLPLSAGGNFQHQMQAKTSQPPVRASDHGEMPMSDADIFRWPAK